MSNLLTFEIVVFYFLFPFTYYIKYKLKIFPKLIKLFITQTNMILMLSNPST